MATVQTKLLTIDEFYEWASRPDNQDKLHELDEGRVVEVPPAGEYHGAICFLIAYLLRKYIFQRGEGYVCTNDPALLVKRSLGTIRGPDILLFDDNRPLRKLSRK